MCVWLCVYVCVSVCARMCVWLCVRACVRAYVRVCVCGCVRHQVSFMSAILILGTPAEMYTAGTELFVHLGGVVLAIIIAALVFVPLLYPLKMTSSFEVRPRPALCVWCW